MKIHVVIRNPGEKKILPRLAAILQEHNGWSVSDRPARGVDLNYFQIYIDRAELFSDWRHTPAAAYFSHYEPGSKYREFWWDLAQKTTNFGIYTAQQYGDMLDIPAAFAHAPVEPMFEILDVKKNDKPRVGVSGFALGGAVQRKNLPFVARLAGDLEGKADVVASGHGWPVKIVNQSYEGLPAFYNSLDAYVCASTIEGVPMPPLEALACGAPVVVPHGVGMLDSLPDDDGVYRYPVGDYGAMLDAVKLALATGVKREQLRGYVSQNTPERWAADHKRAFEDYLEHGDTQVFEESDRHGQRGVFYVAFGDPARKCATGAMQSFKEYLPEVPIALAAVEPIGDEDVFIEHADEDIGGRSAKTKIYGLTAAEWEYVMYLDADTEVISGDIEFLFKILENGWDMVICKNPGRFHVATEMKRSDNVDECEFTFRQIGTDQLIQLNGGVFAFQRNARTRKFFEAWHEEWKRYGKRDQAALLRALFKHPLKLFVLGNQWNTITRYDNAEISAGILHYPMTARRWRGTIRGRIDSKEAWKAVEKFKLQGDVTW